MSTWYEQAIFYHMYPLGITGAPKTNVLSTEDVSKYVPDYTEQREHGLLYGHCLMKQTNTHGLWEEKWTLWNV